MKRISALFNIVVLLALATAVAAQPDCIEYANGSTSCTQFTGAGYNQHADLKIGNGSVQITATGVLHPGNSGLEVIHANVRGSDVNLSGFNPYNAVSVRRDGEEEINVSNTHN